MKNNRRNISGRLARFALFVLSMMCLIIAGQYSCVSNFGMMFVGVLFGVIFFVIGEFTI